MTDDSFRARIDQMINLSHLLAVLAGRLPWPRLVAAVVPCLPRGTTAAGDTAGETGGEGDLSG